MRLDLHLHSTASDGSVAPEKVVEAAVGARLDVIALSDHDTTAGVERARSVGETCRIQVIPALEMSSTRAGRELHILGYFVDPEHPCLVAHEERARHLREERMRGMLGRLANQGLEISFEQVLDAAGPDRQALARPHLARAMQEAGYVATVGEAFDRYIGDGHRAFIPTRLQEPTDAVALILEAGGVPVWAHPPMDVLDEILPGLVRAGLRGLEVYRPRNPPHRVVELEQAARRHGLLVSGGSDWHGPESGELGEFFVTAEEVASLLAAGGM